MKFRTADDSASISFNYSQGDAWRVTLGGNRTVKLLNMEDGRLYTAVIKQDGTGSRTVTWSAGDNTIVWMGGQAPTLRTAANSVDTFTFVKEGTVVRQVGGLNAAVRRIIDAPAQATSVAIAATALILQLAGTSAGTTNIAAAPNVREVYSGTGADKTMVILEKGSGSYLTSASGARLAGIGIGVPNLKTSSVLTDAFFWANAIGNMSASGAKLTGKGNTMTGGGTWTLSPGGARAMNVVCYQSGGKLGYCSDQPNTNGDCTCAAN